MLVENLIEVNGERSNKVVVRNVPILDIACQMR